MTRETTRVLVVSNMYPTPAHPHWGLFIGREVEELRRAGFDVDVVHVDTVTRTSRYLSGWLEVRRAVRARRPDLVHVHYGLSQAFALQWRGPRVVTFHGSDLAIPWQRRLSRLMLSKGAEVIVVSPKMLPHVSGAASVIPCGVPDEYRPIPRAEARARLGLPTDAFVIGFPSWRERAVKDHPLFMQVCELLRAESPDLIALECDHVPPAEMPYWLNALDILLMTSLREGSPVMTREALCCGVRVVSTDVGDVREQLAGFTGCAVVSGRRPAALARAVRTALSAPAPDGAAASAKFGIRRQIEQIERVYSLATERLA